nr:hypothetical protein [Prevotella sp.]
MEHFWNGWASARRDIVLIVCGSATSWMMDKFISSYGLQRNMYSGIAQNEVVLNDLF